MKQISAVMITGVFIFIITGNAFSQSRVQDFKTTVIEPFHIQITYYKTTILIFPYPIKSVDRGSADVLAQKANGVDNILLVKAGRENFKQTNLSIITADNKLYSFLLDYSANPAVLNISFDSDINTVKQSPLFHPADNAAQIQRTAEQVAKEKQVLYGIKSKKYKMLLRLSGIYIKSGVVYYQLEIVNHSQIDYDIDMLRFFIRDAKTPKRTSSQEIEMQPLYVYGDASIVKAVSKNILVYALSKFTIPDQKYLFIQLTEKNGGRLMKLKVHNRTMVKAKPLQF